MSTSPAPRAEELPPRFVEAWLNKSHVVLGKNLLPLSVWHSFLLETIQSPFVSSTAPCGLTDLYTAVRICQLPYGEWLRPRPARSPWRKRWERFLFKISERNRDFNAEQVKFRNYVQDYFAYPEIDRKVNGSKSRSHVPTPLALVTSILMNTGWSEEKVWMLPIGQAYWYSATFAYQNGADIRFSTLTEAQSQFLDEQIRLAQEAKAKRREGEKKDPKLRARRMVRNTP